MKPERKRTNQPIHTSDEIEQKKFPGYPQYAASEDIMNQGKRVEADLESAKTVQNSNITAKQNTLSKDSDEPETTIDSEEDEEKIEKDQFAVTDEDLEALGPEDLSLDMGADEELKHRKRPVDFSGKDLDVPGSELDDDAESTGSEDEENNSYSIGGDDHNDLEESKGE